MNIERLKRNILNVVCQKNEQGFPFRYDETGNQYFIASALDNYQWGDVQNPITRKQVVAWVKQLRSGEVQQTTGTLKDECGMCCLGVLADMSSGLTKVYDTSYHFIPFMDDRGHPGLLANNDEDMFSYLPQVLQNYLARENDGGATFAQIADEIESMFAL